MRKKQKARNVGRGILCFVWGDLAREKGAFGGRNRQRGNEEGSDNNQTKGGTPHRTVYHAMYGTSPQKVPKKNPNAWLDAL